MSAQKPHRIVIALDAADARDTALGLARHLRGERPYELVGLFVEDTYVLGHAHSRLAREIMLSGGERPLEVNTLERQMRAQSTLVQRRFEAAAAQLGLPHRFRVARGELLAELLEEAGQAEALILSLTKNSLRLNEMIRTAMARLSQAPLPLLLLAREGWLSGHSILAIVTNTDGENSMLRTAAQLAKESQTPLKLVLADAALADNDAYRQHIAATVEAAGAELAEIIPITTLSSSAIVQAARSNEARLLILSATLAGDQNLIVELSRQLTSAIMFVKPSPPEK